jgi:hypothetical protein
MSAAAEEDALRRGIEGDDEDSSAFEDARDGDERGRGRTRRVDPQLKKSMLEDALRSRCVLFFLFFLPPTELFLFQSRHAPLTRSGTA